MILPAACRDAPGRGEVLDGTAGAAAPPPVAVAAESGGIAPPTDTAPPDTTTPAPPAPPPRTDVEEPPLVIARQENTAWPDVIVEITELSRSRDTLTLQLTLRNYGDAMAEPEIAFDEAYVLDRGAEERYQVLEEASGRSVASLPAHSPDRWRERIEPGGTRTVWMKFAAPPREVLAVTVSVPGIPRFDDLPIQDR